MQRFLACRQQACCKQIHSPEDLRSRYRNTFQQMRGELSHLDDCVGVHYRLQLNAYRYILEKYYSAVVSGMYVVCAHPDNGIEAFIDGVPVMPLEVEILMEHQRARAREAAQGEYAYILRFRGWRTARVLEETTSISSVRGARCSLRHAYVTGLSGFRLPM